MRQAICLEGDDVDLTTGKTYKVLPDPKHEAKGRLRIVDDSGEDYIYLARDFRIVE